ncbi:MAG TPA: hypothetical protein VHO66_09435 [Ruminiclostridium sp.]|nr:hypothetical protein [Ruminiclostridium sp.]
MPENRKGGPRGPYYSGRTHFSYNDNLVYRPHSFKAHETVQDMVKRAEQVMEENRYF